MHDIPDFDVQSNSLACWLWIERNDQTTEIIDRLLAGLAQTPSLADKASQAVAYNIAFQGLQVLVLRELGAKLPGYLSDAFVDVVKLFDWPVVLTLLLEEVARTRSQYLQN